MRHTFFFVLLCCQLLSCSPSKEPVAKESRRVTADMFKSSIAVFYPQRPEPFVLVGLYRDDVDVSKFTEFIKEDTPYLEQTPDLELRIFLDRRSGVVTADGVTSYTIYLHPGVQGRGGPGEGKSSYFLRFPSAFSCSGPGDIKDFSAELKKGGEVSFLIEGKGVATFPVDSKKRLNDDDEAQVDWDWSLKHKLQIFTAVVDPSIRM